MKIYPSFLFCLFYCIAVTGQQEITVTGTVMNEINEVLPYIDVLLKRSDSVQSVVAFAITDKDGRYQIIHRANESELILETSSLVHEPSVKTLKIHQNTQHFTEDIVLQDRVAELDEVQVTGGPRIQVKNDTTIFNLKRLTNGSERVVEEILGKLPGISIESGGQLKFKGKKVGNVLLDGDNLFNGNYTVGTKNINAAHITGIEAIENFENNPLLQGLSENDVVALNLKFGKGISLSGDAELSYANGNRISANTTAIAVSKKLKGFSIASYNSVGNDLGNSLFNATEFIDKLIEQRSKGLVAPSYIGDHNNLFPKNNSVSNNELFGSLNLLPKLSDTETLRLNIDVLSDRSLEQRTALTLIGTASATPIRIEETNENLIKPLYFNSSIYFQKFRSDSQSWTTDLNFSKLKNEQELLGVRNGQEQQENSRFRELFLSNNSTYTYRLNDKSALKVDALAVFSEKPEDLIVFPGIDLNTNAIITGSGNTQTVYSSKKQLRFLTNYYRRYREDDKFNLQLNMTYFNNSLSSRLTNTDNNIAYENKIVYTVLLPEISADYFFTQKKFSLRPVVSAKIYSYSHTEKTLPNNRSNSALLLDASFHFKYNLNKRNAVSARLGHFNEVPKEENLYTNFILRSNRILENNELNFDKRTSNTLSLFYNYDNLAKNTDINLGFRYEKGDNIYLSANTINSAIAVVTNLLQDVSSENRQWNLSFIKYVSALRSTIRLATSYNNSNYFNFVNGSEIRNNKREFTNATLGIGTSFIGKFLFGNTLTYTQTNFSTQSFGGFENRAITNKLDISLVLNERLRIDTDVNYLLADLSDHESATVNINGIISYQNNKKTITYRLEGRNLLNASELRNVRNTDFSTTITSASLFDRLILVSVNFKY